MLKINLFLLSKHRTELMGVAALMIILCHTPIYVNMPGVLRHILPNGAAGCDIFLFLSGMGICVSYSNRQKNNFILWLWLRYKRIVVPFVLIEIGTHIIWGEYFVFSQSQFWENLTGFYYLTGHYTLWYISCALFLYLLTPIIDILLNSDKKLLWLFFLCAASLIFSYYTVENNSILYNWQYIIQRWPSYFFGYSLANSIMRQERMSILLLVILPLFVCILFIICNHKYYTNFSLFWVQGVPLMTISAWVIEKIKSKFVNGFLVFMGGISLESYITNMLLLPRLQSYSCFIDDIGVNPCNLTFYVLGSLICLMISYWVNWISKIIISRL